MFLRPPRSARSVDYLLAVLSPLDVARSTRRYLDGLAPEQLASLIERSKERMDDDERAYLAMAPDFSTFLEQNRRAVRSLDPDALRAILLPVISNEPGDALVSQLRQALPKPSQRTAWRRLRSVTERWTEPGMRALRGSVTAIAVAGCGVVGVLVGLLGTQLLLRHPPHAGTPVVTHVAAAPVAMAAPVHAPPVTQHHAKPPASAAHRQTVRATPAATAQPRPQRVRVARRPLPRHQAPRRRAVVRRIAARPQPLPSVAASGGADAAPHDAQLVQRARLIVMSYLDSLMRGDASAALGNLGLSASAGTGNLTEAPILAGATEFHIVRAELDDASNAKVQVVIDSPQGRYFGDYIVSANGPAAWITAHEVIPVGNRNI